MTTNSEDIHEPVLLKKFTRVSDFYGLLALHVVISLVFYVVKKADPSFPYMFVGLTVSYFYCAMAIWKSNDMYNRAIVCSATYVVGRLLTLFLKDRVDVSGWWIETAIRNFPLIFAILMTPVVAQKGRAFVNTTFFISMAILVSLTAYAVHQYLSEDHASDLLLGLASSFQATVLITPLLILVLMLERRFGYTRFNGTGTI